MANTPTFLQPSPKLHTFINWLLHHAAHPTLVIVCSDKPTFIEQLEDSIANHDRQPDTGQDQPHANNEANEQLDAAGDSGVHGPHPLLTPTLLNISKSRHVKLAFISSIPALSAYLTAFPYKLLESGVAGGSIVLLNSLALHKASGSWSAQGFGSSIALIVETAWKMKRRLMVVECVDERSVAAEGSEAMDGDERRGPPGNTGLETGDVEMTEAERLSRPIESGESERRGAANARAEPWTQRLPVVAPGTRTFGISDRAWSQKTVSAGDVVCKWCDRDTLPNSIV